MGNEAVVGTPSIAQPDPPRRFRYGIACLLIATALPASFIAGIDPTQALAAWWGVLGSLAGLWLVSVSHRRRRAAVSRHLAAWAILVGLSASVVPSYRADWKGYVGHLRSFAFDSDLDFENEWQALDAPTDRRTPTGLLENSTPVGPALLWSPFYGVAHVYVLASRSLGHTRFEADGLSAPYLRSTRVGTLTGVYVGAFALLRALQPGFGLAVSMLSVLASLMSSTVIYYSVFLGAMAHGLAFGIAAAFLAQWLTTRRTPSGWRWLVLGVLLGTLALCRWQAVVYGLMLLPLGWTQWRAGLARPHWFGFAALGMLTVMLPQFLAWDVLYGSYITIPQGRGFMTWSSPNFWNTLISADRGLFNWTPMMFLGFVGLVVFARRDPMLGLSGLGVFLATAWVNGSVPGHDWQGGDAFGARRFTLVVPVLAVGLAVVIRRLSNVLQRAPLTAITLAVVVASAWNLGLVQLYHGGGLRDAVPLADRSRAQVRAAQDAATRAAGWLAGDAGRAIVYEIFSAEYFYTAFNRSGTIPLYSAGERYLLDGWGPRSHRRAPRTFRRALYPRACLRVPLAERFDLRIRVSARRPGTLVSQQMGISLNGRPQLAVRLEPQFRDIAFTVDESDIIRGENVLCFTFSERGGDDSRLDEVAAEIERVQLP